MTTATKPHQLTKLEDSKLTYLAIEGDAEAFGVLYDRYLEKIFTYIYYKVSSVQTAEDLTETVFLKAYEFMCAQEESREFENFQAWLYRIAHNQVIDHYRTKKENVQLHQSMEADDPLPEAQVQVSEENQFVAEALQQLEPKHQEVIIHRFFNGLSHRETAELMDIKENHTRVLQYRALKKMEEILVRMKV